MTWFRSRRTAAHACGSGPVSFFLTPPLARQTPIRFRLKKELDQTKAGAV